MNSYTSLKNSILCLSIKTLSAWLYSDIEPSKLNFSNKSESKARLDLRLKVFLVGFMDVLFSTPSPPGRLYSDSSLSKETPKWLIPSLYVNPIPAVALNLAEFNWVSSLLLEIS